MFTQKMNLDYATWSFTESGHGKEVADGIGGTVKRCLDHQVLYGHDLRNAEDVFTNISTAMKSVKSFLIPLEEIENMQKIIPQNLRPLPGNNEVHQIITTNEENAVLYRPLSCFCGNVPGMCSCLLPKKHSLLHVPVHQQVPDMTVQVIDQAISNEAKQLHATSHHSENEDFKMTPVDDIASNELPIVVITEPISPENNKGDSEVNFFYKEQVYQPKKSSANCSEKASIMTHRSIKRK